MDFHFLCTEGFLYMNLKARGWEEKGRELPALWVRERITNYITFRKTVLILNLELVWTACKHLHVSLGEVWVCTQIWICVHEATGRANPHLHFTLIVTSKQTWFAKTFPFSHSQIREMNSYKSFCPTGGLRKRKLWTACLQPSKNYMLKP